MGIGAVVLPCDPAREVEFGGLAMIHEQIWAHDDMIKNGVGNRKYCPPLMY